MPHGLLATKISLPMLRRTLVPRKKVLKRLREGIEDGHLLTLVAAPAGYGKTTTLRMWVEDAGWPVAWVTLERSDNDLRQFLTYVLSALQQAEDHLGQAALEVVENIREVDLPQVLRLLIEIGLARAVLYQAEGRGEEALRMFRPALAAAAPRGYCRIFLDEGDLLRPLLDSLGLRRQDLDLSAFVQQLLEALPGGPTRSLPAPAAPDRLSDRELDVLHLLAAGQSYREIGEQLFLSLNTVQFHVKNVYGKLAVNKRVLAIEKARAMGLI